MESKVDQRWRWVFEDLLAAILVVGVVDVIGQENPSECF